MRVLVISAHPDDETLGCGGTLIRHRSAGDELYWAIGTVATAPRWSAEQIAEKAREVDNVAAAYGMKGVYPLGLPTTELDALPLNDVITPLRDAIERARPEWIYVVHRGDVHTDHQVIFTATTTIVKPMHMRRLGVRRLLSYECISSTDAAPQTPERAFLPQVYGDITGNVEAKIEILALYASELHPEPGPRSPSAVRALARVRGAAIAVEHAEAFMPIREIL